MSTLANNPPAARLKEMVECGLAVDILDADRAWFLVDELRGRELPSSAQPFAAALKGLAIVHLTLAVVKLFEKPKGYPLRNIPQALDLLAQGANELRIRHRPARSQTWQEIRDSAWSPRRGTEPSDRGTIS